MIAQETATANTSDQPAPPCPSWCRLPAGHDLDDETMGGDQRHCAEPIRLIEIAALQRKGQPAGVPYLYYEVIDEHGTPADAREFAAELLQAADRLEQILSGAA
jgi:hypothetical protein